MGHIIDTLKKNRKAQGLMLLLVALVVADAGFYLLRVKPVFSRASELKEKAAVLEKDVRAKEATYSGYAAYNKSLADVGRFKEVLPKRSEYVDVVRQVYRIAKDDGMAGDSFGAETRDVRQEGDLAQITFSMPIQGRYKDVRKFINDIEMSPLFLNIDNLGLSTAPGSGDISLSIGLSTYVRS